MKEYLHSGIAGAGGTVVAWVVVLLVQMIFITPRKMYEEQKVIADRVPTLEATVERKANGLDTNDPVFGNTISVLDAFRMYRIGVGYGERCMIFITSPESSMHIARMIAQLQIAVSNCATFGPIEESIPSRQRENMEGTIPGFLIINAPELDVAAKALMDLSPNLPVRRGYKPLPEGRIVAEPFVSRTENFPKSSIWLQFGENVRWGSQR